MQVTELALPGVKIIEPTYFEDYRGYYCETYSMRTLAEYGITDEFVQDNHSMTLKRGTLRGIHFQNNPVPQIKLVRCTKGAIKDVVVDLRRNSPTFKQWLAVELSAENRRQIWIPSGYGHAFLTLQDNCEVQYKVTGLYEPKLDRAIAWNDLEIAVEWGIDNPIVSQKDMQAPTLAESDVNLTMELNSRCVNIL